MAEFPSLPLWTDAYLGDTTHLTTIEHGAYLLLLMAAWRTKDKTLPADDRLLARYAKLTPAQWKRMKPVIAEFFNEENGRWSQSRLTDEAIAVKRYRERQSAAGKASALKRQGRHSTTVQPNGNQTAAPTPISSPNKRTTSSDVVDAYEAFVVLATDLDMSVPKSLTDARKKSINARLGEHKPEGVQRAFDQIRNSQFLMGRVGSERWRRGKGASIDWVFNPTNFAKIIEGKYGDDRFGDTGDRDQRPARGGDRSGSVFDGIFDDG